MSLDSPFVEPTAMDLFEELNDQAQYIVGWKTGMHGPVKTSKSLAKELSILETDVDMTYNKSINYIKRKLLDE